MFVHISGVLSIYRWHTFHVRCISHSRNKLRSPLKLNWQRKHEVLEFHWIPTKKNEQITRWSLVSTAAGALWAGFWTCTRFGVTKIWTTDSAHCRAFAVLQTFWRTWRHLRWQRAITEIWWTQKFILLWIFIYIFRHSNGNAEMPFKMRSASQTPKLSKFMLTFWSMYGVHCTRNCG